MFQPGLGEERRNVATCASAAVEERLAALRGLGVEAAFGRRGCRDGELVEVQGSEPRGDEVGRAAHVAEAGAGGDRELGGFVQARIVERPFAVLLQVRDEGVPVGR